MFYSPSTRCFYSPGIHSELPPDSIELSDDEYRQLKDGQGSGYAITIAGNGRPLLTAIATPQPSSTDLCTQIDNAADAARRAVAGDPLRAVEYDRARLAAEQFAAADYQGEVPAMVAAWEINGRTPQQAADSILAEAAAYNNALELLRTTRLAAKEQVRTLMAAGEVEQAQQLTDQTIAAIEATVAGIGNNA